MSAHKPVRVEHAVLAPPRVPAIVLWAPIVAKAVDAVAANLPAILETALTLAEIYADDGRSRRRKRRR